jgi:hypothetical protein
MEVWSLVEVSSGKKWIPEMNGDEKVTITFGRNPECQIHIDDKRCSREHAFLSIFKKDPHTPGIPILQGVTSQTCIF